MEQNAKTPSPTLGTPVQLDRERRLRYTLGTKRRIREEFGKPLEDVLKAGPTEEELAKILWHGLVENDPELKPGDVEEIIDLRQTHQLLEALTQALGGKSEPAPVPPTPAPKAAETDAGTQ
jgi:hypothetical protein